MSAADALGLGDLGTPALTELESAFLAGFLTGVRRTGENDIVPAVPAASPCVLPFARGSTACWQVCSHHMRALFLPIGSPQQHLSSSPRTPPQPKPAHRHAR